MADIYNLIIEQCSDCCTCPTPVVISAAKNVNIGQSGFAPLDKVQLYPWGTTLPSQLSYMYLTSSVDFTTRTDADYSFYITPTSGDCAGVCFSVDELIADYAHVESDDYFSGSVLIKNYKGGTNGSGSDYYESIMGGGSEACPPNAPYSASADTILRYYLGTGPYAFNLTTVTASSETTRTGTTSSLTALLSRQTTCDPYGDYDTFYSTLTKTGTQVLSVSMSLAQLYQRASASLVTAETSSFTEGELSSFNLPSYSTYNQISLGYYYDNGNAVRFDTNTQEALFYFSCSVANKSNYQVTWTERTLNNVTGISGSSGDRIRGWKIIKAGYIQPPVAYTDPDTYALEDYPELRFYYNGSGGISSVDILYGGKNYSTPCTASLYGGYVPGEIELTTYSGSVVSASIITPGNYLPVPVFNTPTNGIAATASFAFNNYGALTGITINKFQNYGSRYTEDPIVTFSGSFGLTPTFEVDWIIGNEVTKSLTWNGIRNTGSDYVLLPRDSVEMPGSNYMVLSVPTGSATSQIIRVRPVCR